MLRGVYGTLAPGETKEIDSAVAKELADRGLVTMVDAEPADDGKPVQVETPTTPVAETKPATVPVKSGVTFETPTPDLETKTEGK